MTLSITEINPFILIIGISLYIIGFVSGLFTHKRWPHIRQNEGEAEVHDILTLKLDPFRYHLLNNITIPYGDGTTQIDHILVSTTGIFIIETKNYSGWIFGNENSKQWTQVIYKVKNQFQNPIHQNYLHLQEIRKLLDFLPENQIHSIVVFTGDGEFKTPIPKGVLYLNQLIGYLMDFPADVISNNRMAFCVGRIECSRYQMTEKTDLQHQEYLNQKFGEFS